MTRARHAAHAHSAHDHAAHPHAGHADAHAHAAHARHPAQSVQRLAPTDRSDLIGRVLFLPTSLYLLATVAVPLLLATAFALSTATTRDPAYHFVGLRTFARIIADPAFRPVLTDTIAITAISVAGTIALALPLAVLLAVHFKGRRFLRCCLLIPWAAGITQPSPGTPYAHHIDPRLFIAILQIWRLAPIAALVIGAALTRIPRDLVEAARLDGAGPLRRLIEVRLPPVRPILTLTTLAAALFCCADPVTDPARRTSLVLASWAYDRGIDHGDIAQASAIALLLTPAVLPLVLAIFHTLRRVREVAS